MAGNWAGLGRIAVVALALAAAPFVQAQGDGGKAVAVANPGFEDGPADAPPPGWGGSVSGRPGAAPAAFRAVADPENPREGAASVRLERAGDGGQEQFGTLSQTIDATALRGRRIRMTGAVRVELAADTAVGLWLRVDRAQRQMGFFDNMQNRPIRGADWAEYAIEGDVAQDAERIVFGLLLGGGGRAWLDRVRIQDIGPALSAGLPPAGQRRPREAAGPGDEAPRPLDARGLANLRAFARLYGIVRYFHPSDEAAAADWDSLALAGVARVEGARDPAELAETLNAIFASVAPQARIFAGASAPAFDMGRPAADAQAIRWRHQGYGDDPGGLYRSTRIEAPDVAAADLLYVPLTGGVSARVPIALWRDAAGRTIPRAIAPPVPTGKPAGYQPSGFDRTTRLAAVAAAWSMFQHFYPYFDAVRVDWDAELGRALTAAATDTDDRAFHQTLRRLVAALQDGHGAVAYPSGPRGTLPLAWDWVEDRLVVTNVGAGAQDVARGDVVEQVDGVAADRAIAARGALISGSPQWVRARALDELRAGAPGQSAALRLRGADGRVRTVTLGYALNSGNQVAEVRPEPVAELEPGLFYVDLDRVTEAGWQARLAELGRARGIVFDLRGYPRMPPTFLQQLIDAPAPSARFETPIYLRPDREDVTYRDGSWNLTPRAPRLTGNVAFLTGGGAISYAESVLGVVRQNRIGTIVGAPSAGANGNVASFGLPGGYRVAWTGMRVLNRDGSRHHLAGVRPDVPAGRTLAGVRAGRDEPLERALGLVRGRMTAAD